MSSNDFKRDNLQLNLELKKKILKFRFSLNPMIPLSDQTAEVVIEGHFKPRYCVPLAFRVRSLWIPSRKCVPFINMHNGRVHDVIYCYNLGKKCVPPY